MGTWWLNNNNIGFWRLISRLVLSQLMIGILQNSSWQYIFPRFLARCTSASWHLTTRPRVCVCVRRYTGVVLCFYAPHPRSCPGVGPPGASLTQGGFLNTACSLSPPTLIQQSPPGYLASLMCICIVDIMYWPKVFCYPSPFWKSLSGTLSSVASCSCRRQGVGKRSRPCRRPDSLYLSLSSTKQFLLLSNRLSVLI